MASQGVQGFRGGFTVNADDGHGLVSYRVAAQMHIGNVNVVFAEGGTHNAYGTGLFEVLNHEIDVFKLCLQAIVIHTNKAGPLYDLNPGRRNIRSFQNWN